VTCNRPGSGWAPFRVNLTATSVANTCRLQGQAVLSTALTVPQSPTLTRTSPSSLTLCSLDPNVTLTYTLSSIVAGAQFNLVPTSTNAAVNCTATPSTAGELIAALHCLELCGTAWHTCSYNTDVGAQQIRLSLLREPSWVGLFTLTFLVQQV